jgi:hypothetical protein
LTGCHSIPRPFNDLGADVAETVDVFRQEGHKIVARLDFFGQMLHSLPVRRGRPVPQKTFPGDDTAPAGRYIPICPVDVPAEKFPDSHSAEVRTCGFRLARDQTGHTFLEAAKTRPLRIDHIRPGAGHCPNRWALGSALQGRPSSRERAAEPFRSTGAVRSLPRPTSFFWRRRWPLRSYTFAGNACAISSISGCVNPAFRSSAKSSSTTASQDFTPWTFWRPQYLR